ncbi:MAG: CAP domain-containing protein [Patescibacteria group bacterium]|nr:CAP domain-containing protein [Patescibacteria group bacterium]
MLIGIFLLPQIAYSSAIAPEKLIELTNQERIKTGLKPLTANQLLAQAAYQKGNDILINQAFRHNINDKKFSSWIKETGYKYSYVGENLAIDFVTSEGVIAAWLNSHSHKKNLLGAYFTEIGVAVIEGKFQGQNTILIVQIFGAPAQAMVQPWLSNINTNKPLPLLDQNMPAITYAGRQAGAENLLTHSIAGQSILSGNLIQSQWLANHKLALNYNTQNQSIGFLLNRYLDSNIMSKFFKQISYLLPLINFLTISISIILILSMLYIYFFYFLYIHKLIAKIQ